MRDRLLLLLCLALAAFAIIIPGCRADSLKDAMAQGTLEGEELLSDAEAGTGVQPLTPEAPEEPEPLYVYVSGAVARPGVYQLPQDARGCDALSAAGGPTEEARLEMVNLAAHLTDGQQLHIPSREEAAAIDQQGIGIGTVPRVSWPVNVNRAAAAELTQLPGIGLVLAGRIIAYRVEHGPFTKVDDLLAVPGIGESKLNDIRDLVSLGP